MDYFNPESGTSAGYLHRTHLAAIERGPWSYGGLKAPLYKTETDSETGESSSYQAVSGTCDCCGSPIIDVAIWRSASGERMTLGLSCSETFARNIVKQSSVIAKVGAAIKSRAATKRKDAKIRKGQRNAVAHAELLTTLDAMGKVTGFAADFSRSLARQIRDGKKPSEKQTALLAKLTAELAAK